MLDLTRILNALDEASDAFDDEDVSPERAHQFRSHLATARMAAEHAAKEASDQ